MNFKALALGSLITIGSIFGGVAEVEASTRCKNMGGGYDMCFQDNGRMGTDMIGIWKNGVNLTYIEVLCTGNGGNRWKSETVRGTLSKATIQGVANTWCSGY
jgi:hypothetical protein